MNIYIVVFAVATFVKEFINKILVFTLSTILYFYNSLLNHNVKAGSYIKKVMFA